MNDFEQKLIKTWYSRPSFLTYLLWPLTILYRVVIVVRCLFYRCGLFRSYHLPVPVIVVGNLTVGGTGKTPLIIYLAELLKKAGYHPGIISRGYGGDNRECHAVTSQSPVASVGDEPLLIYKRTQCPTVIGRNRVAAAKKLLAKYQCDVILSDDGLQHYSLQRDIEIAVIDGARGLGNRLCLPAGPLREAPSRLNQVDFIVNNGGEHSSKAFTMQLLANKIINIMNPSIQSSIVDYRGKTVHAVAAIGHPERFFSSLENHGLIPIPQAFPDHYFYKASDLQFADALPIIMTEKDAVKCMAFNNERLWYLPIDAELSSEFIEQFCIKLKAIKKE
jgi:tetraacyldisaccharide 4'-kinase